MDRQGAIISVIAEAGKSVLENIKIVMSGKMTYCLLAILVLLLVTLGVLVFKRKEREKKMKKQAITEQILSMDDEKSEETEESEEPEEPCEKADFIVGKLHNVGKRSSQQDSFAVSDEKDVELCRNKGLIAIVADGMGGLSDGDKISSMVTISLLRHFYEKPLAEIPGDALLEMLKNANDEVNTFLEGKTERCGSTLVTGIVKDNQFYWLSVGDSHIYLYRGGNLILLNREHTYEEELDLKVVNGELSKEEAAHNSQRSALTSYIGMGKLEKIDRNLQPLALQSGDRLIFATDGVFGTMKESQIAEVMKYPVEESIRLISEWITAVGKKNQDNYTAVILELR